jgi:hypothetical protein
MATTGPSVSPLFVRYIQFTLTDSQGVSHDYQCQITQAGITSTGGDPVSLTTLCPEGSFSENAQRVWNLALTAVQDVESDDSLMLFLLQHETERADYVYYPKVDKAGNPQGVGFKGTVTLVPPDQVGNVASGAWATFTATLPMIGKYTMIDEQGNVIGQLATGATAGTPGTWTPAGSVPPANLAALTTAAPAIVASPATAWTTGQYVLLGDASHAHWNATAWVTGDAP